MIQSRETSIDHVTVNRQYSTTARTAAMIALAPFKIRKRFSTMNEQRSESQMHGRPRATMWSALALCGLGAWPVQEANAQRASFQISCANLVTVQSSASRSFSCGEEKDGAIGWLTRSPTGATKTAGHEASAFGVRTASAFTGTAATGRLAGTAMGRVEAEAPSVDFRGDSGGWYRGSFDDQIGFVTTAPGIQMSPVRFTLVMNVDLSAGASGADYLRNSYGQAIGKLSLPGQPNSFSLELCAAALAGSATSNCPVTLAGAGTHRLTVERIVDMSVNPIAVPPSGRVINVGFEIGVSAGIDDDLPPFSGSAFGNANGSLELYIEPLDPRVQLLSRSGFNYAPVPEPGTWALLAAGLGVIVLRLRRAEDLRRAGGRGSTRGCLPDR